MELPTGPRNLALATILSFLAACDTEAPTPDHIQSQTPEVGEKIPSEVEAEKLEQAQAEAAEARDAAEKALRETNQLRAQMARPDNGAQAVQSVEVVALPEEMEALKGQLMTGLQLSEKDLADYLEANNKDNLVLSKAGLTEEGKWIGVEQKLYDDVCVPFLKVLADPKVHPDLAKAILAELAPKVKNNPAGRQFIRAANAAFGQDYRGKMTEPDQAEGKAALDTRAEYALFFLNEVAKLKSFPFKKDVTDNVVRLVKNGVTSTEREKKIVEDAGALLEKLEGETEK